MTYVLCYLLWIVSVALALFDLVITRELLGRLSALLVTNIWILSVVDKFGLFILGLAWLRVHSQ